MAQAPLENIFLGHTPSEQRNYITKVFSFLLPKFPKIVIPAVGQFTLAKCALEAGYKPDNIYTSDISLFSTLLGFLFDGKPVSDIHFELSEIFQTDYDKLNTDEERIAFLMWVMKLAQMKKITYNKIMYQDLLENRDKHFETLLAQVMEFKNRYTGIHYQVQDLRQAIFNQDKDTLVVVNPPVFSKGYTKMFDFGEYLKFDADVPEFDFKKEYIQLYAESKKINYPVIWYRFRDLIGIDKEDVIFAKEYEIGKEDYWIISKPEVLADFPFKNYVASFKRKNLRPYSAPLFSEGDEIKPDSKISFVNVPEEVGLYYRDLFAHKLGNTKAEAYFLMLIDGKVYSTVGFMLNGCFRLQTDKVYETFGFSVPNTKYPHENRLLMMMITCSEMKKVLHDSTSKKNRIYSMNGLKTTCLSTRRSIKTHHGILNRVLREKLPNGSYRIQAETNWHDRTFSETLKAFLKEEEDFKNNSTREIDNRI